MVTLHLKKSIVCKYFLKDNNFFQIYLNSNFDYKFIFICLILQAVRQVNNLQLIPHFTIDIITDALDRRKSRDVAGVNYMSSPHTSWTHSSMSNMHYHQVFFKRWYNNNVISLNKRYYHLLYDQNDKTYIGRDVVEGIRSYTPG